MTSLGGVIPGIVCDARSSPPLPVLPMRRSVAAVVLASTLVTAPTLPTNVSAQTVSYAAGTFPTSEWTETIRSIVGPISHGRTNQPGSGNPGDYSRLDYVQGPTTGTTTFNVAWTNPNFVFNPAVHGLFTGVTFTADVIGFTTGGFSTPFYGNVGAVMLQNGVFFQASPAQTVPGTSWTTLTWNWLATDTWAASVAGATPDFSANAAPIVFGFRTGVGTSCPSQTPCRQANFSLGVDNYAVKVYSTQVVPEPSTVALLATGLAALGVVARRRRVV